MNEEEYCKCGMKLRKNDIIHTDEEGHCIHSSYTDEDDIMDDELKKKGRGKTR